MTPTEARIRRALPRLPLKIMAYAWLAHMAVMTAATIGVYLWPSEPAVAWLEEADATGASRAVIDFFARTPRVDALLEHEAAANYPPEQQARDRQRYAVSHAIIELGFLLILLVAAVPLFWGIRRCDFFLRYKGFFRPGMSLRPIFISIALMLVIAIGMGVPLYEGAMTQSRRGPGPSDAPYLFQSGLDFALLTLVCCLAGLRRVWLDRAAPAPSRTA